MRLTKRHLLNAFGLSGLAAYCLWWAFWLLHGRLPPAPILFIAGLPAPTTGLTRSVVTLFHGDWQASLRFNCLGLPIAALFAASIAILLAKLVRRQRLLLPACFLYMWAGILSIAWLAKLLGDQAYW